MHPMFEPENLYSFSDRSLNQDQVDTFCRQIQDCRNPDDLFLASQKAHWMLCAFWHGARDQFEYAQVMIRSSLDQAEDRF